MGASDTEIDRLSRKHPAVLRSIPFGVPTVHFWHWRYTYFYWFRPQHCHPVLFTLDGDIFTLEDALTATHHFSPWTGMFWLVSVFRWQQCTFHPGQLHFHSSSASKSVLSTGVQFLLQFVSSAVSIHSIHNISITVFCISKMLWSTPEAGLCSILFCVGPLHLHWELFQVFHFQVWNGRPILRNHATACLQERLQEEEHIFGWPGAKKITRAEKQKNKKEHCTFHPGRLHFHSSSASKSLVANYATVTRYIPIGTVTFSHIS